MKYTYIDCIDENNIFCLDPNEHEVLVFENREMSLFDSIYNENIPPQNAQVAATQALHPKRQQPYGWALHQLKCFPLQRFRLPLW